MGEGGGGRKNGIMKFNGDTDVQVIDTFVNEVNSQSRSSDVLASRLRVAAAQTYRCIRDDTCIPRHR